MRVNHFRLRHWKKHGTCICPTHAVSNPIIQTSTVQGHPRSMVMVPIGSPLVVSYLTSIVSNVVSFTVFVIFLAEVLWPRSRRVQGYPRSKVMVPVDSPWATSYSTSIDPNVASVNVFKIQNLKSLVLPILDSRDIEGSQNYKSR